MRLDITMSLLVFMYRFYGAYNCLVLCAWSQDSLLSASVSRVHVVFSILLDLRAEESRVERHVPCTHIVRHGKPPSFGEASREPRAYSGDQVQAVGALAYSFTR